jgi:signal peptidase II
MLRLGLVLAALVFILDQAFKWWLYAVFDIAAREPVTLVPGFDLVLVWNTGISYGWFAGHANETRWILVAVSFAVTLLLLRWLNKAANAVVAAALGLIIGGALANALDRIVYGAVMDMFHFHVGNFSWYVFNLADVAIVGGVLLLLYDSLGRKSPGGRAPVSP